MRKILLIALITVLVMGAALGTVGAQDESKLRVTFSWPTFIDPAVGNDLLVALQAKFLHVDPLQLLPSPESAVLVAGPRPGNAVRPGDVAATHSPARPTPA